MQSMKSLIYTFLLFILFPSFALAQNSLHALGKQRVIIIRIALENGSSNSQNTESIRDSFLEASEWFQQASYGQTTLEPIEIYGPYTLDFNGNICLDHAVIADLAIATADPDINFQGAKHVVVMTPLSNCSHYGVRSTIETEEGTFSVGREYIAEYATIGVLVHELGHGLGLLHAESKACQSWGPDLNCDFQEYGNLFDVMGSSIRKGNFQATSMHRLGWLQDTNVLEVNSEDAKEEDLIVNVTLEPQELSTGNIKLIKFVKWDRGTNEPTYYTLEKRAPYGNDRRFGDNEQLPNATTGVMINVVEGIHTSLLDLSADTPLASDAALPPGDEFSDLMAGISIRHLGNVGDSVNLQIEMTRDTLPPRVFLTSPTRNTALDSSESVLLQASALDNRKITSVSYYKDDELLARIESGQESGFDFFWNLSDVEAGFYQIYAVAEDSAGNLSSRSRSVGIMVEQTQAEFVRGDANQDGQVDISDPIKILNALFYTEELSCLDAADSNDDGILDISDAVYLFGFLFGDGTPPDFPYPNPGIDKTSDQLGCIS